MSVYEDSTLRMHFRKKCSYSGHFLKYQLVKKQLILCMHRGNSRQCLRKYIITKEG